MKPLIINKPSLAPLPDRIGWAFFKALFWILWIGLWMPLITLLLWLLGAHFYNEYFLDGLPMHRHFFLLSAGVVVALGASLLLWAKAEFLRFHLLHRRNRSVPVACSELAEFAQISDQQLAQLSTARRMIVHHTGQGKFLYAEIVEQSALLPDSRD